MNNKVNNGMLICSFYMQKRYQHGNNRFSLNSEISVTNNKNTCVFFDALNLFESFCDFYNDLYDDEINKKVFSVNKDSIKKYDEDKYRALSFVIRSGNYGVEADMTDRKTKK